MDDFYNLIRANRYTPDQQKDAGASKWETWLALLVICAVCVIGALTNYFVQRLFQ